MNKFINAKMFAKYLRLVIFTNCAVLLYIVLFYSFRSKKLMNNVVIQLLFIKF